MPTALITDAARGSALAFIRSLGRRGWRIIAASEQRLVPAFSSRFVDERIRHPRLSTSLGDAGEALVEAAGRTRPDLVVPVTDLAIHALTARRDRLPPGCVLAAAEPEALAATMDKRATLELASRSGVPVPPTERATGVADAERIARAIPGPWVVKPERSVQVEADGAIARPVALAGDAVELQQRLAGSGPALVQQWLPGVGVGVEMLLHEGRPLAALQHRRIRETPWTGGASSCRVTEALDARLYDHAAAMLGSIGWTGLAMVEFRVGPGGPVLMEINGRVWGSLPLAVRAGMDFPARLADLHMEGPPRADAVDTGYRVGVRGRDLELERQWIAGAWRSRRPFPGPVPPTKREAVRVAAGLLVPTGYDSADWRDPLPMAVEVVKVAGAAVRSAGSS